MSAAEQVRATALACARIFAVFLPILHLLSMFLARPSVIFSLSLSFSLFLSLSSVSVSMSLSVSLCLCLSLSLYLSVSLILSPILSLRLSLSLSVSLPPSLSRLHAWGHVMLFAVTYMIVLAAHT